MRIGKNIFNEFFWFFLGTFIPMLIGLAKTTVFTRVFSPEEFGRYGLIFITFTIISITFLTWNTNVIWRYFHYFDKKKGKSFFLSNLSYLMIGQIFLFFVCSLFYLLIAESADYYLIIIFMVQMVFSHILNTILTIFRVYFFTIAFNVVQIIRTSLSFSLLYWLVFAQGSSIEVFVEAILIIEIPIIIVLLIFYRQLLVFKPSRFSLPILKLIFKYIPPSLISNLGLILLANSDRYVINHFEGLSPTGLYNQAYNLTMMGINGVILVFIKVFNPYVVKIFDSDSKMEINGFMKNLMQFYLIILTPLTIWFSIYAKDIIQTLMGTPFHSSYVIVPWIAFGMLFTGIIYFYELKMKFNNKNNQVIIYYLVVIVLNIILNILSVPIFGYEVAAITTMVSYFVMLVLFLRDDFKAFMYDVVINKVSLLITMILIFQLIFHTFMNSYFMLPLYYRIIEGTVFFIIYGLIIWRNSASKNVISNVSRLFKSD